jgi:hypothetical protein
MHEKGVDTSRNIVKNFDFISTRLAKSTIRPANPEIMLTKKSTSSQANFVFSNHFLSPTSLIGILPAILEIARKIFEYNFMPNRNLFCGTIFANLPF